jgi:hypothetical protein
VINDDGTMIAQGSCKVDTVTSGTIALDLVPNALKAVQGAASERDLDL